jgi:hypothetical protein
MEILQGFYRNEYLHTYGLALFMAVMKVSNFVEGAALYNIDKAVDEKEAQKDEKGAKLLEFGTTWAKTIETEPIIVYNWLKVPPHHAAL